MTETAARPQLSDRYTATSGRVQLTGVQALARLPIDQHRRDLAAGTLRAVPVTGVDLTRTLRAVWTEGRRLTGPALDLYAIAARSTRR